MLAEFQIKIHFLPGFISNLVSDLEKMIYTILCSITTKY